MPTVMRRGDDVTVPVTTICPDGLKKITERFRGSSKDSPSETMPTSADLQKAGRVIGYFERFIIVAANNA